MAIIILWLLLLIPLYSDGRDQSTIRINIGGGETMDAYGDIWLADRPYDHSQYGYKGGALVTNAPEVMDEQSQSPLYQSGRSGAFAYFVEVPDGTYNVIFVFVKSKNKSNQRITVSAGKEVLFDSNRYHESYHYVRRGIIVKNELLQLDIASPESSTDYLAGLVIEADVTTKRAKLIQSAYGFRHWDEKLESDSLICKRDIPCGTFAGKGVRLRVLIESDREQETVFKLRYSESLYGDYKEIDDTYGSAPVRLKRHEVIPNFEPLQTAILSGQSKDKSSGYTVQSNDDMPVVEIKDMVEMEYFLELSRTVKPGKTLFFTIYSRDNKPLDEQLIPMLTIGDSVRKTLTSSPY